MLMLVVFRCARYYDLACFTYLQEDVLRYVKEINPSEFVEFIEKSLERATRAMSKRSRIRSSQ
ncbi:MAG: hypothetical protein FGF50_08330 [Candidatus Brockarchaeota archaeon]|nr:hypothetical protein [Candidatus Brockarchaeota archaeon]